MPPFQRTIEALAKSHNEAATPTLIAAMSSGESAVFDGAIAGLVSRRCKAGHLAVLRRWHELSPVARQTVDKGVNRMGGALRDALLSTDDQLFANALSIVKESGDFDLLPTLVTVAEQPPGLRSQSAIDLTLQLIDRLVALIAAPREPSLQRDPETMRQCVLESLERSVERFREHRRTELIEAFVVLAGPHSHKLLSIINSPHHACFRSVIQTLNDSTAPGVIQLLTTMLVSKDAPQAIRNAIGRRADPAFVEALLAVVPAPSNAALRKNLSRIKSLAACEPTPEHCQRLSPDQQAAAMRLVASSGASDEHKLELAAVLLKHGSVFGRVAACTALQPIPGQRSSELVLTALRDEDGHVQAAAVRQLRERHIPGTMAKLMKLLDSPHDAVSRAAREALSEFSFDNYIARFDGLEEQARRTMGTRVARVDQNAVSRLKEELASPSRRLRLRALQMAESMGLCARVADGLVERLADEDHVVRAAAADALRFCTADDVRNALLAAVEDGSVTVQNAARSSLQALGVEPAGREVAAAVQEALP